jgi:exodeoxyribonuclease VII large subunit
VPVQGRDAPAAIVAMLGRADRSGRYDALLLTRGGGANEDLAAFNEEAVVRAVAACATPVVVAVGHEIDYTLVDFAADLRAATPSAAAELLVPDAELLRARLGRLQQQLRRRQQQQLQQRAQRLDGWLARLRAQHPLLRAARMRERLLALRQRLGQALPNRLALLQARLARLRATLDARVIQASIRGARQQLAGLRQRQRQALLQGMASRRARFDALRRALQAVSPLATLQRGYAIALDAQGHVLRSAQSATVGQLLRVRLADGELAATVTALRAH